MHSTAPAREGFFFCFITFFFWGRVGLGVIFRDAPIAALVTNLPIFTHIFTYLFGHLSGSFILLRKCCLVPAYPCLIYIHALQFRDQGMNSYPGFHGRFPATCIRIRIPPKCDFFCDPMIGSVCMCVCARVGGALWLSDGCTYRIVFICTHRPCAHTPISYSSRVDIYIIQLSSGFAFAFMSVLGLELRIGI